jgi:Uncharacterized protein family UPF0016
LLLAARFQRPLPIIWGIFVATLTNHLLPGLMGAWVRSAISPEALRVRKEPVLWGMPQNTGIFEYPFSKLNDVIYW